MAYSSRNGAAHRAVALDLMLRTFMNSPDFQPYNPKMWDGIAKMIPGISPQQCILRWEELRIGSNSSSSRNITRDFSSLTAKGRPITASPERQGTRLLGSSASPSARGHKVQQQHLYAQQQHLHTQQQQYFQLSTELPPIEPYPSLYRSRSVNEHRTTPIYGNYRLQSGKFTASFCQTHLVGKRKGTNDKEREESAELVTERDTVSSDRKNKKEDTSEPSQETLSRPESSSSDAGSFESKDSSTTVSSLASTPLHKKFESSRSHVIIHVHDDSNKIEQDFVCPRDVLIREMQYFKDYLSPANKEEEPWEDVDISVHCDVSVFNWLMQYAKRGMLEGTMGEQLLEPLPHPQLEPQNVVSVLISSDFLKMNGLVENALQYCALHMAEVLTFPCNMNCINKHLLSRIAHLLSPSEVEDLPDHKDKIKNKLYFQLLERWFELKSPSNMRSNEGSALFRCKFCGKLLTHVQQSSFPCSSERAKIDRYGRLTHVHERDEQWDVNYHIKLLKQSGLSWREVYWKMWGIVNWLVCRRCNQPFHCTDLSTCAYHSGVIAPQSSQGEVGLVAYSCCGRPDSSFSPMTIAKENGCCYREHLFEESSVGPSDSSITAILGDKPGVNFAICSLLKKMKEVVCIKVGRVDAEVMGAASSTSASGQLEVHLLQENRQQHGKKLSLAVPKEQLPATDSTLLPQNSKEHTSSIDSANSTSFTVPRRGKGNLPVPVIKRHQRRQQSVRPKWWKGGAGKGELQEEDEEDEDSSSSSSDIEEDESDDEEEEESLVSRTTRPNTKRRISRGSCKRNDSHPPIANLVWDCSQSVRWNQDMQRDSDEKRAAQLKQQLLGMYQSLATSSHHLPVSAGGVFCQLETQFRAQQALANKAHHASLRTRKPSK